MNYTFQFNQVLAAWPQLLQGTWVTIQLSFLAMAMGLAVAIVCAWGKTSGPAPLRFVINAYIELIRNTPFLVQLFFFFFALPAIGLRWSPQTAALVAMVVNLGAYATEIIRAGIESIPKGQIEAGLALDLKRWEIFRFVILKPALKTIWPGFTYNRNRIGEIRRSSLLRSSRSRTATSSATPLRPLTSSTSRTKALFPQLRVNSRS